MSALHTGRAVVVGVDGSEEALRAVRWAAPEARRRHAELRLVSAFELAADRVVGMGGFGVDYYGNRLRAAAENDLAAAAAVAAEVEPGIVVSRELVVGFAGRVLVEQSRDAQLVVVGDRGRGRIASVLAGSVAVGVAVHARCPVVVVRGAEQPGGPVVVGIDGTPACEAVIAFAFEAASTRRAPLVAVHTWVDALNDPDLAPLVDWAAQAGEEEEVLAERLAGWGSKYPDVAVERVVAHSRATNALLDRARGAQLVVVGSRGHGELAGVLLGSVSNALVHAAPCPVAVVRPAGG